MPNLDDHNPIVEPLAAHKELLDDLQCNILSSNGRTNTHYFFLTFPTAAEAKRVLGALAGAQALPPDLALEPESSSRGRRAAYLKFKKSARRLKSSASQSPRTYSTNLLLTSSCYSQFLPGFAPPVDPAFAQGMATRDSKLEGAAKLNDTIDFGRAPPVHALYVVGHDLPPQAWGQTRRQILGVLGSNVTVHEESGYVVRHQSKQSRKPDAIEPFGYRDAISQPLFFENDLVAARSKYAAATATGVGNRWSSFAPLSLVLVPDPHGTTAQPCGSYVAYRKIVQKVDFFYAQAQRLSSDLKNLHNITLSRDEVADHLIGRRVDGTTLDQTPNEPPATDFTYNGSVCPMHAHARKMNPRDKYVGNRRIVRRATVFGPKLERAKSGRPIIPTRVQGAKGAQATKVPDDVGLLFFCCQADIAHQFEEIQSQWANRALGGADTVIGQPSGGKNAIGLKGKSFDWNYESVVEVTAGEYFFAPSISFFSRLK